MLFEIERHTNCTVIICQDDQTGEIDISWWDNENPPMVIEGGAEKYDVTKSS